MERAVKKGYPLDNSATIHLASRRKNYTNSFRISVTLTEDVSLPMLQEALARVMIHFPTIAAGIRPGVFQYEVVPAAYPPAVCPDQEYLAVMDDEMLQSCAMRILYKEKKISVEFFHALTDGYGGWMFVRALLTEYFSLKNGNPVRYTGIEWREEKGDGEAQVKDDFLTYAGTKTTPVNHRKVYRLSHGGEKEEQKIHVMTGIFEVQEVLDIAHSFGVSLTTFLTAAMASSVIRMETDGEDENNYQPIQIMVPVNLRRIFESSSVRNFSLYTLPCVEPSEFQLPFAVLIKRIDGQIKEQISGEHLAGMISTNVKLQKMRIVRSVPLVVREAFLRLCFHFFGERNSCLTLSNLGEVLLPDAMQPYVERAELILSPRRNAPYNCGVSSYRGKLYINFSSKTEKAELGHIFFRQLSDLGCRGGFEMNHRFLPRFQD